MSTSRPEVFQDRARELGDGLLHAIVRAHGEAPTLWRGPVARFAEGIAIRDALAARRRHPAHADERDILACNLIEIEVQLAALAVDVFAMLESGECINMPAN